MLAGRCCQLCLPLQPAYLFAARPCRGVAPRAWLFVRRLSLVWIVSLFSPRDGLIASFLLTLKCVFFVFTTAVDGEEQVTQMAYCKATKVIISADYHGNVVVTSEVHCKLKEVRWRKVKATSTHIRVCRRGCRNVQNCHTTYHMSSVFTTSGSQHPGPRSRCPNIYCCTVTPPCFAACFPPPPPFLSSLTNDRTQLRKMRDVHGAKVPIAGMAYSYRLSKIVTCSSNAEVRIM